MTVLEVIKRSSEFLTRKEVESPRLQAELLLAHVLQLPRLKLYLNFERTLTETEVEVLRKLVKRRGDREPLQHILGSTSFCGLEMEVNGSVLIPRPETELLAERAWNFLSPLTSPAVLDLGTGTGCLAITLAVKNPQAAVHALDISNAALEVARLNAARHQVAERIQFHASDGFAALPPEVCFDLVVSNPPYIPSAEIEKLEPEVRDYDPKLALDGGPDGLVFYRRLAVEAPPFLTAGGVIMLEFGDGQEPALRDIFASEKWIVDEVVPDYSARPRILIARRPK